MGQLEEVLLKLKKERARGKITPQKAQEMLRDGTAHGKTLTPKQRRWLYWQAGDNHKW